MKSKLLFHPKVTIAALSAALLSLAGSCTAFVAALAPLLKLAFLAPYFPVITRIDGDLVAAGITLTTIAGILSAVAAAGRSFIASVDAGGTAK